MARNAHSHQCAASDHIRNNSGISKPCCNQGIGASRSEEGDRKKMNMEELQEQLAAAEARATELEDKLEFYTYRNNCRWERLWHFAHEELPEDLRNRYFHIVANGTADTSEHPRIAQEYNMLKHRAGQAEARAQSAEVQLATLRPKLADCEEAL